MASESRAQLPDRIASWHAEGAAILRVLAAMAAEHVKALQELEELQVDVERAIQRMPANMAAAKR